MGRDLESRTTAGFMGSHSWSWQVNFKFLLKRGILKAQTLFSIYHLQFWRIWIKKFTSRCSVGIKEQHVAAPHAVITLVGWDASLLSSQPQNQAFWQKIRQNYGSVAGLTWVCTDLNYWQIKGVRNGDIFHILRIFFNSSDCTLTSVICNLT